MLIKFCLSRPRRLPCLLSVQALSTFNEVYFSGIQPTGVPHVGNYFGFVQTWLRIQENKPDKLKILAVVDLHAITVGFPDPKQFRENILSTTASLLASGVDPRKTVLFRQSDVLEHTELFWILGSLQSVTRLNRMPQYKDKSKEYKNNEAPIGLLCYPVLQASDVLLYKGTHVPVGEDQDQHIQVLRNLAGHFNVHFKCNYFPVPDTVHSSCPRMKSLKEPTKKMSKSDKSKWSRIEIADSADVVSQKIMKAVSDSTPEISYDPNERPAVSNLISIYSAFTGQKIEDIVKDASGLDQREFKERLVEVAESVLKPIRGEYERLIQDQSYLEEVLREGGSKAREIAQRHLREVKQIVGFL